LCEAGAATHLDVSRGWSHGWTQAGTRVRAPHVQCTQPSTRGDGGGREAHGCRRRARERGGGGRQTPSSVAVALLTMPTRALSSSNGAAPGSPLNLSPHRHTVGITPRHVLELQREFVDLVGDSAMDVPPVTVLGQNCSRFEPAALPGRFCGGWGGDKHTMAYGGWCGLCCWAWQG
jgi:hypothetical protein